MKITNVNYYIVLIDEMELHIHTNLTRKKLEQYINDDKGLDGTFRPNRLLDTVIRAGFYFRYIYFKNI